MAGKDLPLFTHQRRQQRAKHRLRAAFRAVGFLGLCVYAGVVHRNSENGKEVEVQSAGGRHLLALTCSAKNDSVSAINKAGANDEWWYVASDTRCGDQDAMDLCAGCDGLTSCDVPSSCVSACDVDVYEKGTNGMTAFACVIGVMYMFLALAVVCDEYFVPALDAVSDKLELSNDVAGATFMAAGGSAPELFTSFIGTFQESSVGFGTIVGSALFNVLFVIGVCAMTSKDVLELTWWPLFRDCIYYAISLGVLAAFMGDSIIKNWEAAILFIMYFGYVLLMKCSASIETYVKTNVTKELVYTQEGDQSRLSATTPEEKTRRDSVKTFNSPMAFRTGIYKLITSERPMLQTAGVAAVATISGDVNETFRKYDRDGNGFIEGDELKAMLTDLLPNSSPPTNKDVEDCRKDLDTNNDNKISEDEFNLWYIASENRLKADMVKAFEAFDENNSGSIDKDELKNVLVHLGSNPSAEDISGAMQSLDKSKNGEIESSEFYEWYQTSLFWHDAVKEAEVQKECAEGVNPFEIPEGGLVVVFGWIIMLPLVVPMHFLIPDTRTKKWRDYAPLSFVMSIVFIGIYSFFMVEWATIVGDTIELPTQLMGLTFLAAGTSVPDLLSSVIVAKQGHGDMAVSSSIGSNIFDVLVGLPFPWLVYSIVNGNDVSVGAGGLGESILILLGMLCFLVMLIAACKWKMSKRLGGFFFGLYFAFVAYSLAKPGALDACPIGYE